MNNQTPKLEQPIPAPYGIEFRTDPLYSHLALHAIRAEYSELGEAWSEVPFRTFCDRLYFPEQGTGYMCVNGAEVELSPGHIYLVPTGCVLELGRARGLGKHWCHFVAEAGRGFDLFELIRPPAVLVPDDPDETRQLHLRLQAAMGLETGWGIARRAALLIELLLPFLRAADEDVGDGSHREFLPVLRYINENLAHALRLEELADLMHVSTAHFSRTFREAFGLPPMHYVVRKRIQHAQRLVCETALSAKEIGFMCGFSDPYNFSKAFKRHAGLPPGEYRRRHGHRESRT